MSVIGVSENFTDADAIDTSEWVVGDEGVVFSVGGTGKVFLSFGLDIDAYVIDGCIEPGYSLYIADSLEKLVEFVLVGYAAQVVDDEAGYVVCFATCFVA